MPEQSCRLRTRGTVFPCYYPCHRRDKDYWNLSKDTFPSSLFFCISLILWFITKYVSLRSERKQKYASIVLHRRKSVTLRFKGTERERDTITRHLFRESNKNERLKIFRNPLWAAQEGGDWALFTRPGFKGKKRKKKESFPFSRANTKANAQHEPRCCKTICPGSMVNNGRSRGRFEERWDDGKRLLQFFFS